MKNSVPAPVGVSIGLILAVAIIAMTGCVSIDKSIDPDSTEISTGEATPAIGSEKKKNPLILIPGILGSELSIGNEKIWCSSCYHKYAALKLPVTEVGVATAVKSSGIMKEFARYHVFWVNGYNKMIEEFVDGGYKLGTDLFVYHYDWRKSNFDSAEGLRQFIQRIVQERGFESDQQFDIVAHSMGGIVAKLFILEFDERSSIDSVITLGTPYRGAFKSLMVLADGYSSLPLQVVTWKNKTILKKEIAHVFRTFPSLYELVPNPISCSDETLRVFRGMDVYDVNSWFELGWFDADENTPEEWRSFYSRVLSSTKKLHEAMSTPYPSHVTATHVVGDMQNTLSDANYSRETNTFKQSEMVLGDSTVTVGSADNCKSKRAVWTAEDHSTLFEDNRVSNHIIRNLDPMYGNEEKTSATPSVLYLAGESIKISQFTIDVSQEYINPNDSIEIEVMISTGEKIEHIELDLSLKVEVEDLKGDIQYHVLARNGDRECRTSDKNNVWLMSFCGSFNLGHSLGYRKVSVILPGLGSFQSIVGVGI